MSHPSYGPLGPDEIAEGPNLPLGVFAQRVQRHDPLWGRESEDDGEEVATYTVEVRRTVPTQQAASFDVEARSEAEARSLAEEKLDDNDFLSRLWWGGVDADPAEDYEIESVEKL